MVAQRIHKIKLPCAPTCSRVWQYGCPHSGILASPPPPGQPCVSTCGRMPPHTAMCDHMAGLTVAPWTGHPPSGQTCVAHVAACCHMQHSGCHMATHGDICLHISTFVIPFTDGLGLGPRGWPGWAQARLRQQFIFCELKKNWPGWGAVACRGNFLRALICKKPNQAARLAFVFWVCGLRNRPALGSENGFSMMSLYCNTQCFQRPSPPINN